MEPGDGGRMAFPAPAKGFLSGQSNLKWLPQSEKKGPFELEMNYPEASYGEFDP
jgi:hypothetical protein